MVIIGYMPRFDAGKAVLHRAQDGQLTDAIKFTELAALLAATLDDPTGWNNRQAMNYLLIGLIRHDGLPHDDWHIRRADLANFADRIKARLGYLPIGFGAWAGIPAEVSTSLVRVSTKRLVELLKPVCPSIENLTREFSRTPWLQRCAGKDPQAGNGALAWDYRITVEALRDRGCLHGLAPDPDFVKSAPTLHVVPHRIAK